jgi:hypothetical protein
MARDEPRDPFIEKFFGQIAPQIAQSFTPVQLAAIKVAFGSRSWSGRHWIDLRLSIPFLWRRYYLVLLAGPERRSGKRRSLERPTHPLATLGNAIVTVLFALLLGFPLLLALFALFASLDTGFGPGVGAGSPSFVQELINQIGQLFR